MSRPLRVMMLGLRGFPGVQGGVETHAEQLCLRLVELGCEVTVLVRAPYQLAGTGPQWRGVKFVSLWAPKSKGLEAIIHSLLGVCYAAWKRPDILHIQAIGPAIVTLPARLLGLRVVVTHHGPDYDRQKWGRFARLALRTGERFGMRLAQGAIVISQVIADIVRRGHGRQPHVVPNGVVLPAMPADSGALAPFGLLPGRYVLLVSRLVPEKRHLDLVDAFERAALPGWKLAIVGASDHPDAYVSEVLARAGRDPRIVCTGLQTGAALAQLYAHAGMFVLPSSHEGLPIALLEALSYGLPVIASDIPANLEVGLPEQQYFPLGEVARLAEAMERVGRQPATAELVAERRAWVAARFDWDAVAAATMAVYREVRGRPGS
ncbi:glycosyltransferase family 4 protein [Rugamonas sp. DEMB1]|uniref:glycosyltransferase family 4 protein n=1 Tax=Rugamonas sp. DEMB1 TaxID=3039386 RepID=UPI0024482433|nr:glycosyltransferase family 4 protein [Rugamonas sp. DEMB1]WGG49138.1 glycosyltransferase family 4 protein [Rugamonas sp. DEMB1]